MKMLSVVLFGVALSLTIGGIMLFAMCMGDSDFAVKNHKGTTNMLIGMWWAWTGWYATTVIRSKT